MAGGQVREDESGLWVHLPPPPLPCYTQPQAVRPALRLVELYLSLIQGCIKFHIPPPWVRQKFIKSAGEEYQVVRTERENQGCGEE